MSLPYPPPEPIKTTLRCKFGLPGKRYDCRALGKYVLNGVGYCAWHFDTVWKVLNPVFGQAHDWYRRASNSYDTCRQCGDIRPHDSLPLSPCRGVMPEIRLWNEVQNTTERNSCLQN